MGGAFTNAGGNANADYIATWNGSAWGALGSPVLTTATTSSVSAIAYHAGKVYVGGTFTNAGGNPDADFLAVWDGVSWAPFCNDATPPAFGGNVLDLQIIGSTLWVGGTFQNGAHIASADYLLGCDLNTGVSTSPFNADGDGTGAMYALTADNNGNLYGAGTFINLDGIAAADYVAYRDPGGGWNAMGAGPGPALGAVTGITRSLAANGTDVYVGSDALDISAIPQADHVAKWNGTAWSAVGSNTAGTNGWLPTSTTIDAITTFGPRVFVIGSFQNANGDPLADNVASFDGSAWHPVGSNGAGDGPLNASGRALATFDQRLYAGGSFTSAGGDTQASFAASFPLSQPAPPPGTPPPPPPPPPRGPLKLADLPDPVQGVTANVEPVGRGPVLVGIRAGSAGVARARASQKGVRFVPLREARQIPVGSFLDTRKGKVRLQSARDRRGTRQQGDFGSGLFQVLQSRKASARGLTDLVLKGSSFTSCRAAKRGKRATAAASIRRRLRSSARGRFRTRGRHSAATVRGTTWTTTDRCDGTLTKVTRGRVAVRDFRRKKTVLVRAGKSYLARATR